MHPIIKEQLKLIKLNKVKINDKIISKNDINDESFNIIFSKNFEECNNIIFNKEYYFTFDKFLIKSVYNNIIPFEIMKGIIVNENIDEYYLELKGIDIETNKCLHCFKFGKYHTTCMTCDLKYRIDKSSNLNEQFSNIQWKGFIKKDLIKNIEEKK